MAVDPMVVAGEWGEGRELRMRAAGEDVKITGGNGELPAASGAQRWLKLGSKFGSQPG
ncbi:MAG: hypothetical protein AAGF32_01225 [Pseudomonadota bacterium]